MYPLCDPKLPKVDEPCVIKDEHRDIYTKCSRMCTRCIYVLQDKLILPADNGAKGAKI